MINEVSNYSEKLLTEKIQLIYELEKMFDDAATCSLRSGIEKESKLYAYERENRRMSHL